MTKYNPELDKKWHELQKNVDDLIKKDDFQGLSFNYYQMAVQLWNEKRPFIHILKLAKEFELRNIKRSSCKIVEIRTTSNSCTNCKNLNETKMSIEDALRTMPLPCTSCIFDKVGFCRCIYLPVIESIESKIIREKKGNIGCWTVTSLIIAIILIPVAPVVAAILTVPAIWSGYKKWKKKP